MDFEKTLTFTEQYAREYILYLVEFFGGTPNAANPQDAGAPEGKVAVFAVISAAVGVYLGYRYVQGTEAHPNDLMGHLAVEFLYWVVLSILLEATLIATRAQRDYLSTLITVLKVLPAAYAAAGFAAFVAYHVRLSFPNHAVSAAQNAFDDHFIAYVTFAIANLLVCLFYLPPTIHRLRHVGWVRAATGSAVVLLSATVVLSAQYLVWLDGVSPPAAATAVTAGAHK